TAVHGDDRRMQYRLSMSAFVMCVLCAACPEVAQPTTPGTPEAPDDPVTGVDVAGRTLALEPAGSGGAGGAENTPGTGTGSSTTAPSSPTVACTPVDCEPVACTPTATEAPAPVAPTLPITVYSIDAPFCRIATTGSKYDGTIWGCGSYPTPVSNVQY